MRLAEDRNDLRHLQTERPVLVGERRAVTLRFVLLPFGRVRPYLDALSREWRPVARAAHSARHPETTLADPLHGWRALEVIVRAARHRGRRRKVVRARRQQERGYASDQN